MPLSLTSLKKLWFSITPSTTKRMWMLWTLLRPLTPKPRLQRSELLSKLRSDSTVEVRGRDLVILFLENAYRYWSGHINHSLFWKNLAPAPAKGGNGGHLAEGPLKTALLDTFGSIDNFKKEFNTITAGIQGSGWGWLVCSSVYLTSNVTYISFRGTTIRRRRLKLSPLPTRIHS